MKKLKRNAVKCNKCGDVIESTHIHDFKWCSCKNVAVDGGLDYAKICFATNDYEELIEYEKVGEEKRVLLVTEEELMIIQESLDYLFSSSNENPNIDYEVFGKMMDTLYYKEFEELPLEK